LASAGDLEPEVPKVRSSPQYGFGGYLLFSGVGDWALVVKIDGVSVASVTIHVLPMVSP
jgi:hypothetical protein